MNRFIAALFALLALAFAPLAHAQYVPPASGAFPVFLNQGGIGTSISGWTDINVSTTYYNPKGFTVNSTCVDLPSGNYYVVGSVMGISNVSASNEIGAAVKTTNLGRLSQTETYNFVDTQNVGTSYVVGYLNLTSSDCVGLQAKVRTTTGTAYGYSLTIWQK